MVQHNNHTSTAASASASASAALGPAGVQRGKKSVNNLRQSASNSEGVSRLALCDSLSLFTTRTEDPLSVLYEAECTSASMNAALLVLDFEGSENFKAVAPSPSQFSFSLSLSSSAAASASDSASGASSSAAAAAMAALSQCTDTKLVAHIQPFTRVCVGKVLMIDDEKRATLRMGCEWKLMEPNEKEVDDYMHYYRLKIMNVIDEAEKCRFPPPTEDPYNEQLALIHARCGIKFVDREFLPNDTSLYPKLLTKDGRTFTTVDGKPFVKNIKQIEFKRPEEFMSGIIQVFCDDICPDDIRQGALGNCWFLSALAAMTEFPELIQDMFPDDSKNTAAYGGYNVRFCKNGIWTMVRVDDFFPCYPGGGPIYSRNNGNELWVLLAEKAFAKLHGCYAATRAGWVYEALTDLTGAPCKTFRLDDSLVEKQILSGHFWKELIGFDAKNYLLCASTPGEDREKLERNARKNENGLIGGHAYSLIACKTVRGIKLCKFRNPWGSMEWNGDWSDVSPLWTPEMMAGVGEKIESKDDGTFWMCFEDVVKNFFSINVCMVRHPRYNPQPWHEQRLRFFFDFDRLDKEEELDAETKNIVHSFRVISPLYHLTVSEKGVFVVGLHQQDIRCADAKAYIDVGVAVLKHEPTYGTMKLITGTGNTCDRQNQTVEFELEAGRYIVVPLTSGCKLRQLVEDWQRDSEKVTGAAHTPLIKKGVNNEIEFTTEVVNAYTLLFQRLDVDGDGFLNKTELDEYMLRTEGSTIEESAFLWLVHNFESKESEGLSVAGFIRAQLYVFRNTGSNEEKLWQELKALGYDHKLQLRSGRGLAISVHGTSNFTLEHFPYDENISAEAQELVIVHNGERTSFEDRLINLYSYRAGYYGVSLLVENCHHLPLVFSLDCSESENVVSHRGVLTHTEMVPPNQRVIFHHLIPKDIAKTWSWGYAASFLWDENCPQPEEKEVEN